MPHLVEFDHDGAALGLGFLGVDFGEALDPGLHARRRHAQQLGGAVHRQSAQVEEHRRDLDPERHAARRRVGEVQPAGPAAVALLAAHEAVLDVLLAPASLAPQRHPFTPSATSPPMDIGNLCGVETLNRSSLRVSKGKSTSADHFEFTRPSVPTLLAVFEACHNLIWRREKGPPAEAFYEFAKILFVKLRKDRDLQQKVAAGLLTPEDVQVSVRWV